MPIARTKALTKLRHRNLPLLLLQAREGIFARFRPLLNEAGLTEQQWRIIRALLDHGPLEPRQIGQICCLSSASLAGILARMEELRLIRRADIKHDQRRVLVSVARKGKSIATKLIPQIEASYQLLEVDIGLHFTRELYKKLDLLLVKLGENRDF